MQYRSKIPDEPAPNGIVLVNVDSSTSSHTSGKDSSLSSLMVRLPAGAEPGDTIVFDVPDSNDGQQTMRKEPLIARLESKGNRWRKNAFVRYSCFCCIWCFPNGVVVSELTLAFVVGLWIGLSFMYGFAMGTLKLLKDFEEEPEL